MEDFLVGEEMAWACSGVGPIFGAHYSLGATPTITVISEEQQEE